MPCNVSYSLLARSCRLRRKRFRHGGKHCFPLLIAGYQSSPCLSSLFSYFFSLTATMRGKVVLTGKASLIPFVDSLLPKAFVNVKDFFKVSGIFFLTLCGHHGCPVFPFYDISGTMSRETFSSDTRYLRPALRCIKRKYLASMKKFTLSYPDSPI